MAGCASEHIETAQSVPRHAFSSTEACNSPALIQSVHNSSTPHIPCTASPPCRCPYTRPVIIVRGELIPLERGYESSVAVWLSVLVVSALGIEAPWPRFESRVAPLFQWVATLSKLFTHIASIVSQLQENGVQKGSFRRLSDYGDSGVATGVRAATGGTWKGWQRGEKRQK